MAAEAPKDNCINFVEMKFINNTLYFKAENDENLESDYFSQLECSGVSVIRNLKNQVLFFDSGSQAVFEDMTDYELEENKDQTTFIMYVYKDSLTRGVATTISVKYKTIFTLSCENKATTFKEMCPPRDIPKEQSDIIFFQRDVPGHHDKVQFESSLYQGYFLACQKENDLFKLILKEGNTCVDKSVMFSVQVKE